jgi:hypothetical protein
MNNRSENLRLLCPNCHSQTGTYAGRRRDVVAVEVECPKSTPTLSGRVPPPRCPEWSPGPWSQAELEL